MTTPVHARFDPNQRRDSDGQWTDGGTPNRRRGTDGDRLGLAGRIQLGDGDQLILSDRLRSSTGYNNVDYAIVRGGRGDTELRLHTAGDQAGDTPWDGANEWTAQLDSDQVAELRTTLTDAVAEAERRNAEAGDNPDDDRIGDGTVGDEWGRVDWSTWLTDDTGGWHLELDTFGPGNPDRADGAKLTPAQARRLLHILGEVEGAMTGRVTASTATLARRDGVELARSGVWDLSTGVWRAAPEDFAAAIAAMSCPAIDRPYLRLGHSDPRFPTVALPPGGDGEPALGWIENLRVKDGGNTFVGDWVDIPEWLNSVAASAYPRRSIEGAYNRRCSLGHTHPFVLDGLALLGITRPGVGTLKPIGSVDDVRNLFAPLPVAASSSEVRIAASIPGTAVAAAAEVHTGAMIALVPTAEDAQRIAVDGGETADQLHCTIAYLGDAADLDARARQDILDAVTSAANGVPAIEADAFALNVFNPGRADRDPCIVLGLSGDLLDAVHSVLSESVRHISPEQHAPWHAHMTLIYTGDLSRLASVVDRTGPVKFDRIRIAFGGENVDIPLIGDDGAPGEAYDDGDLVEAAADPDDNKLRNYWVFGKGRLKWKTWTQLYKHIRKHVDPERAKRIAAAWFKLRYGYWPGDRRNRDKVAAADGGSMPNPQPTFADRVREAWNATTPPFSQHVHLVRAGEAIVLDEADRSFWRIPLSVDGDTVTFGVKARVMPDFVDFDEDRIAASVVFASRAESRPDVAATVLDGPPDPRPPAEPATPAGPPPDNDEPSTPPEPGGVPISPGAEPEQQVTTEPKEGPVPDMSELRSRLGLADDADEAAILTAIDGLKSKAEAPPEPTPDQIAASAAVEAAEQEKDELRKEVKVLASQVETMSAKLAATEADRAATVKASVLDAAQKAGKFKPADRGQWEKDYDEAPGVTTRLLDRIAAGTEVPVVAAGYTGTGDESIDDEYERMMAHLDGPTATVKGA